MSRRKKDRKQWTATGAARAARDARVATGERLRTTDLAVKLETQKLISSYQIKLRVYEGNQVAARQDLFGSLGYSNDQVPGGWPSAARMVLDDEARCLTQAQLYVMSPQMCDVVLAAPKNAHA